MANVSDLSFSLFIQRGPFRLELCNGLRHLADATQAALEFAELRYVGLQGMVIFCETTGERWIAEELVEATDRPTVPTPCPKDLN